jgi:hypothetical protein
MNTFLEIIDNVLVRKISISDTFPVFKMTVFSAVNFLSLIMWYLFNITVTSNARDVPMYRLIKKVGINIKIVEDPLIIVGTKPLILVTKKAIFWILGKKRWIEQAQKHKAHYKK